MNLNSHKLLVVLAAALLIPGTLLIAAETDTPANKAVDWYDPDADEPTPVEIDAADTIEAGQAEHAFMQANPCEGMEKGDYLGPNVCADCHQDKVDNMKTSPHGQAADARTPYGREGCETCHGPGMLHFETEGNCIISLTGRYGESVEQRNGICLQCHQSGKRMHWSGSTHEAEDLACVSCHSIHKKHDVTERTAETEVCYSCHQNIRAQTFRVSRHPIRENKVICSDCHNPHGSAGPSSLKQFTINENCYSCHAEKRGPFLWEHQPASEDCTLCHNVHGSNHAALLNKPGPQLCQQCHSAQAGGGARTHIGRFLDYGNASDPGVNRFVVAANCANCHSKVHGSNHPSGPKLQR
jgi:DmsE family decaheme c-type cytochrome